MNSTNMRLWAGLFVLVVFVAGAAAGFALRPLLVDDAMTPRFVGRGLRGGGAPLTRMTERLLDRIASNIDLTSEQESELRLLFDSRRDRMRSISEEVRDRFEAEQDQMSSALAEILTEDQLAVFENEIVRMRRRERGPRGPRGGPGSFRRGPRPDGPPRD